MKYLVVIHYEVEICEQSSKAGDDEPCKVENLGLVLWVTCITTYLWCHKDFGVTESTQNMNANMCKWEMFWSFQDICIYHAFTISSLWSWVTQFWNIFFQFPSILQIYAWFFSCIVEITIVTPKSATLEIDIIYSLLGLFWGRVTHICVSELTIIGSDNGLLPGRRQAIIWNNAGLLLIEPLGTNVSEISIGIHTSSFEKMHLNMSSAKWRPFCLGLNVTTVGVAQLFETSCIFGQLNT